MTKDIEKLDENIKDFVEINMRNVFKNKIATIKKYLEDNQLTLEQAIQEVHDKKSKLSANNRATLIIIKLEILNRWLYGKIDDHAENEEKV